MTVSSRFPSPYAKPMFPIGVSGSWHGSGVVTPSGAFLYVYSDGNVIREATFEGWVKLLHNKESHSDIDGVWFTGLPDSDVAAITEHDGVALVGPACTVFWEAGTLWVVACYRTGSGGAAKGWIHLYRSPSGEGGDWEFVDTIQGPITGAGLSSIPVDSCAGPPLVVGGAWVLAASRWTSGESLRPAIWRGSPGGGWTCVCDQGFGPFGVFGGMGSREVVATADGTLLWSAWSDSSADGTLGTRFVGAYSTDDGASWTKFADTPVDPAEFFPRHQQLGVGASGYSYRANNNAIERTTDPLGGEWEQLWRLTLERGRAAESMLWREVVPGAWLMFSHDKVWWMFGGWVVGAIGHS